MKLNLKENAKVIRSNLRNRTPVAVSKSEGVINVESKKNRFQIAKAGKGALAVKHSGITPQGEKVKGIHVVTSHTGLKAAPFRVHRSDTGTTAVSLNRRHAQVGGVGVAAYGAHRYSENKHPNARGGGDHPIYTPYGGY